MLIAVIDVSVGFSYLSPNVAFKISVSCEDKWGAPRPNRYITKAVIPLSRPFIAKSRLSMP